MQTASETSQSLIEAAFQYHQQGQLSKADPLYARSISLDPENFDALHMRGVLQAQLKKFDVSVELINSALKINPESADAWSNLGNAYQSLGALAQAIDAYQHSLNINQEHLGSLTNLGAALRKEKSFTRAEQYLRKALALNPACIDAYIKLGNVLSDRCEFEEAQSCFNYVLQRIPDNASALTGLGQIYRQQSRLQEAIQLTRQAIALDPDNPIAHFSLGIYLLSMGDFTNGWREYMWRLHKDEYRHVLRHYDRPVWDGSDLTGKRLFIYPEQGIGDFLQFVRYVKDLSVDAKELIVEAPKKLYWLINQLSNYCTVITPDKEPPEFDMHVSQMSLPALRGTTLDTIPCDIPYFKVDEGHINVWKNKLQNDDKIKLGIVWQGNQDNPNDRNRSLSLESLKPLAELKGVELISLQKGFGEEQLQQCSFKDRIQVVEDWDNGEEAFKDTAAMIENLDLLISCDTAVVHLAGAMGKPVWVLLSTVPDFRWMLDREDSPWYPSVRLFRQQNRDDWQGVISAVKQRLVQEFDC